ncbi:hypothetical protein ACS5PU_18610 [Pedobacter sp. GSP4]|uniref:hypothetical protein n=1 Tax=Pedobacter sp. GSP4 TaxID=3453716 RepID=UPI003EEF9873
MKEIPDPQMIYIAKKLAYYSALIGTIIFVSFLLSKATYLMGLGLVYILSATVINAIFLLVLVIELIYNPIHWRSYLATIICMLLNIPLSMLYFFLVTHPIF